MERLYAHCLGGEGRGYSADCACGLHGLNSADLQLGKAWMAAFSLPAFCLSFSEYQPLVNWIPSDAGKKQRGSCGASQVTAEPFE